MTRWKLSLRLLCFLTTIVSVASARPVVASAAAQKSHASAEAGAEKHDHGADRVAMSDEKLAAANIVLAPVEAATLGEPLILNGLIRPNQERLAQVTPRFPGIVKQVQKSVGDRVRKDELIAKIESNQSLTSYDLRAPIDGTVIDRQASLGEYVSEQKPAFVVADLSTVWVDFSVYLRDLARVREGDVVEVEVGDGGKPITGRISYVAPIGSADTQSATARALAANSDGRMRPGLFVRAALKIAGRRVPLAIKTSAIQTMEGKSVVFVREGDVMEAQPVRIGDQDDNFSEVLEGLEEGELYAAENSFVLKSEIGKSEGGHSHD